MKERLYPERIEGLQYDSNPSYSLGVLIIASHSSFAFAPLMLALMSNNGMSKILFIEDEAALQKTVGEILEQEGFEVLRALDGETGINLAKTQKPDLILMDLILPKKDGFEVIKELKRNPETADMKIMVLTNLGSNTDVERALELGATTYLVKADYALEEIVEKVKDFLNK